MSIKPSLPVRFSRVRRVLPRSRKWAALLAAALMMGEGVAASELPTQYNLNDYQLLTPVKNQGSLGICWAFGVTTAFEGNLLKTGIVTNPKAPEIDLSEWHLATHNGIEADVTYPYDGWGGNLGMATSYWTRGRGYWTLQSGSVLTAGGGPVLEGNDPLNVYPRRATAQRLDLSPYVPPASQTLAPYVVTEAADYNWNEDPDSLGDFQEAVKEAILEVGAIATHVHAPGTREEQGHSVWYSEEGVESNHLVAVVGWDDDIVLTTLDGREFVGGWYIQNSWGQYNDVVDPVTGESGYLWIPYADLSANVKSILGVTAQRNIHPATGKAYAPTYIQNQIFGAAAIPESRGFDAGTLTLAASKQVIPSNSLLGAIGLWQAQAETTFDLRIYDKWGANGPEGGLVYEQLNLSFEGPGTTYQLFQWDEPLRVTEGKPLYVVLDFGDGTDQPIFVDTHTATVLAPELGSYLGLSWMSSDGVNWSDLFSMDGVSVDPAILFMKLMRLQENLDNLAGIDARFDFTVDGALRTSAAANSILGLRFEDGGVLTLDGPLTVTGGYLHTGDEYAFGLVNGAGTLFGSGDLRKTGPGSVQVETPVEVRGELALEAGMLALTNRVKTQDLTVLPGDGNALYLYGETTVTGDYRQGGAPVRVYAPMSVAGHAQIDGGGFFEVNEESTFSAGALTLGEGTLHLFGHLAAGEMALVDRASFFETRGTATTEIGTLTVQAGAVLVNEATELRADRLVLRGVMEIRPEGVVSARRLRIGRDGWLFGTGHVQGNLFNRGTITPGYSPGTLTISGNFSQSGPGLLEVEVESFRNHDRLRVGGTASLGGTLRVLPGAGFAPEYGDRVAGVIRAREVTGQFDRVESPAPYRWRAVAGERALDLFVAPRSYTELAITPNQRRVAKALDRFIPVTQGDAHTVSTALDQLRAHEYAGAFDAIAPGMYESLAAGTLEIAFNQGQQLGRRFRALQMGVGGWQMDGVEAAPFGQDGTVEESGLLVPSPENRWGVWAQGNGLFSRESSYHASSGGFLIGADYRWCQGFATGLYAGYQNGYSRYGEGKTTFDGARFGGYAAWGEATGFFANAALSGGYTSYDVRRPISFRTLTRTARSQPNGFDFESLVSLGYQWQAGGWRVGPVASAQYTWLNVTSQNETGAGSLNLNLKDQEVQSLRTHLGGQIAYQWEWSPGYALVPQAHVFWQHEFLNDPRSMNAALSGGGGSFVYRTGVPKRDSVYVGGGFHVQLGERWNLNAFYNGDLASGDRTVHQVTGGVAVAW